ncbi:hypothetical protein HPO96_02400 [Kribbella sandramycini]|uniref:Uncharacterized protein n=1 Tax=Kribbella sandramycini TaxID=60450 RepID=A0A7Y4KUT3_9ACTN|nr:hypothetical protein [Kribbella sandramycini]
MRPRVFELVRYRDPSGVSGTGVVAEGCEFSDGSVALRWRGDNPATAVWPGLEAVLAVHGHQGATEVRWLDTRSESGPSNRPQPPGGIDQLFDDLHRTRPPSAPQGWAGARHLR